MFTQGLSLERPRAPSFPVRERALPLPRSRLGGEGFVYLCPPLQVQGRTAPRRRCPSAWVCAPSAFICPRRRGGTPRGGGITGVPAVAQSATLPFPFSGVPFWTFGVYMLFGPTPKTSALPSAPVFVFLGAWKTGSPVLGWRGSPSVPPG